MQRLHSIWTRYAQQFMALQQRTTAAALALDLHGCKCTVNKSTDPQHRGISGIVLKASEGMLHLITDQNKLASVDRRHSEIQFCIGQQQVTLLALEHL